MDGLKALKTAHQTKEREPPMNTSIKFSSRFASLAACAVLASSMSLVGCATDGTLEGEETLLDEEMVGETSDAIMVNTANTQNLPAGGGNGGDAFGPILCPEGSVVTGITVNSGTWINNVQLKCTAINDDGTFGATSLTVKQGGTQLSGINYAGNCPAGQVFNGQSMHLGNDSSGGLFVKKLGGQCSSLSRILADASGIDGTVGPYGRNGTSQQVATCPAGMAVIGMYGRSGWWIDQFGFVCGEIVMPHVAAYPVNAVQGQASAITSVDLNGSGLPAVSVAPGATVDLSASFNITHYAGCPSSACVNQIIVGLGANTMGVGGESPKGCIYSGVPSMSGTSGTGSLSFTAPTVPGIYPIRFRTAGAYSCDLNWWTIDFTPSTPENIGFINVF